MAGGLGDRRGRDPLGDRALQWCWKNRQKRSRMRSIGTLASQLASSEELDQVAGLDEVRTAIAEVVDEEFRHYCTLGGLESGVVRVLVKDPDVQYHMRVTWHLPLKEHLERCCPNLRIRRIRFETGTGGVRFEIEPM